MLAKTYKVKSKLTIPLPLSDGQGDEVIIPPLATVTVEARFVDFQLPQRHEAEVLGYDYSQILSPDTASE